MIERIVKGQAYRIVTDEHETEIGTAVDETIRFGTTRVGTSPIGVIDRHPKVLVRIDEGNRKGETVPVRLSDVFELNE